MTFHNKNSESKNYIKYPRLVNELLDSTDVGSNDTVLEIGPGKGIITKQLADRVKKVIGVEKDKELADELKVSLAEYSNVEIINMDILDYKLLLTDYKIVANIPFNITAKIINKILESPTQALSMYLVMQLEAAEKYTGGQGETQSSILTKPWYETQILGFIDRTNFTLKPQVKIVFIEFLKRETPFIKDEDKMGFRDFVIWGFNQWQPTLMEGYKKVLTFKQIATLKKTLKIGEVKPSELSFDKWLLLFKMANKVLSPEGKTLMKKFRKEYQGRLE